jgi:ribA/ribD-fused uncharacterized protein
MSEPPITSFRGTQLSNFAPVPGGVLLDGVRYPTVEHGYQAAKAKVRSDRAKVLACSTAGKAKALGRKILIRDDWEEIKLNVMLSLLQQKFAPGTANATTLLETGDREIIEGNTWGDRFWGQCPLGVGENHLGLLLMKVRAELRESES